MATQAATLQKRVTEKKDSVKSLKSCIGQRHFNGPVAGPKDFSKDWDKGWNKDGH